MKVAEEGRINDFSNLLNQKDYFPESFFYQWLGMPENVFLYSKLKK